MSHIDFEYLFSLAVHGIESERIGDTARGARIYVQYGGGVASFERKGKHENLPDRWKDLSGTLVYGSDWVTVRRDGVIEFESRISLSMSIPDLKPVLLSGMVQGVVDLKSTFDTFEAWSTARGKKPLHFPLIATFDTPAPAPQWASKEYPVGGADTFALLSREQLLVKADVTLDDGLLKTATFRFGRLLLKTHK